MSAIYKYRGQSGQWSWLLHRISGVAIFVFLLLHVAGTYLVAFGPEAYNELMGHYASILFRLGEVALLAGVLYHAINGLRIILVDFWPKGVHYQRQMFYATLGICVVVWTISAFFMLRPIVTTAFIR